MKNETLAWLHLSDWHHRRGKGTADRRVIRDKLLSDIKDRRNISAELQSLDFVIFSGDASFSGQESEFADAKKTLFDPIKEELGGPPILFVPGNHDVDRGAFGEIPLQWRQKLFKTSPDDREIEDTLQDPGIVAFLNRPLAAFNAFANGYSNSYADNRLFDTWQLEKGGKKIALFMLNSAWPSARFTLHDEHAPAERPCWDYGMLRIAEGQLRAALSSIESFDIGIVVMHHPLYWLTESEQGKFEQIIHSKCHILMHGHEHRPRTSRLRGTYGDITIVPAGAAYNRRNPADPRNANAYNFGLVDLKKSNGVIFHRFWDEVNDRWDVDQRSWHEGKATFHLAPKKPASPFVRTALDALQANYTAGLNKRWAKQGTIGLKQIPVNIDGEKFVRLQVQYKFTLGPGVTDEPQRFIAGASRRIMAHPNANVRAQAYEVLSLSPFLSGPREVASFNDKIRESLRKGKTDNFHDGFVITPSIHTIDYTYSVLEEWEGVWMFELARFFEKLSFSFLASPEHEYETAPLGGLPPTELTRRGVFDIESMEIDQICLPKQGYLVQWYPRKTARRDTDRPNKRPGSPKSKQ